MNKRQRGPAPPAPAPVVREAIMLEGVDNEYGWRGVLRIKNIQLAWCEPDFPGILFVEYEGMQETLQIPVGTTAEEVSAVIGQLVAALNENGEQTGSLSISPDPTKPALLSGVYVRKYLMLYRTDDTENEEYTFMGGTVLNYDVGLNTVRGRAIVGESPQERF